MWKGDRRKRENVQSFVFGDLTLSRNYFTASQFQWPRRLKRGSAAVRLLVLRVWISPGVWMSVSCECCVLSGRGICFGSITGKEKCPTEYGVSEYDLETSTERGLRSASGVETRRNSTAREKYDRKLENGHGHYQYWILQLHVSFFYFFCCRSQFNQKKLLR
jgi:hypothetical protein